MAGLCEGGNECLGSLKAINIFTKTGFNLTSDANKAPITHEATKPGINGVGQQCWSQVAVLGKDKVDSGFETRSLGILIVEREGHPVEVFVGYNATRCEVQVPLSRRYWRPLTSLSSVVEQGSAV
ncbi:hypothetical protein ANN_02110 [Periplaneta americana]|uniref:Per a allergen n=1 Tax=Periplaneta americana TaxID=6978 RepID=A0ABQ8TX01_PERAM|nr:hypothetical protein ANN_02110 [Periplaneta americana]